jgi:hypothetical protein
MDVLSFIKARLKPKTKRAGAAVRAAKSEATAATGAPEDDESDLARTSGELKATAS